MSSSGLVHDHMFIFNGTNFDVWKTHMLNHLRVLDPNIERILDIGFSPPKDYESTTLEDEKNLYLDALASKEFCKFVSVAIFESIMPLQDAHELWTKLQDKYGVSNAIEDDCSPSTSGRDEFSSSTTSPKCGKPQSNVVVSSDRLCNFDSELFYDGLLSLSCCNASSLDLNSSSTPNVIHASVDSPCISSKNCLYESDDDMLAISCCHDKNACVSSSPCVTNNVDETQPLMKQDMNLSDASTNGSSSSTIFCLMAKSDRKSVV